ncbi:hypothetical protein PG988_015152 [Apiospora saccharicola]
MPGWREEASRRDASNGLPANKISLVPKDFSESNVSGTTMTVGEMNNTNTNITATQKEIFAFLDGLEDVDPPTVKDMGNLVYGWRYIAAHSASCSIKAENNSDVDMDEVETIHDEIKVTLSDNSTEILSENATEIVLDNSTEILSSGPEAQAEDRQGGRGRGRGRGGGRARLHSSENDDFPSRSSGEETESPAPILAEVHGKQKEEEHYKYYYFATGLHMAKVNMEKDFPGSVYICLAKLKGYRWLLCGPRHYDFAYLANGIGKERDPEGYATIAPVYKDIEYDRTDRIVRQSDELDLEGSCVYGSLYEVSIEAVQAITADTLKLDYMPKMIKAITLEKDRTSLEPELAGSMPLIMREKLDLNGDPITVDACTYLVDGVRYHLPWRKPDIDCGGHMEVGRLRDYERAAMLPYMRAYNMDCPASNTPYPLPQFALDRRNENPRPLSHDNQPAFRKHKAYLENLRDVFSGMLFDGQTPLWYVNEVLRPWVNDLEEGLEKWPHPHSERDRVSKVEDEGLYD